MKKKRCAWKEPETQEVKLLKKILTQLKHMEEHIMATRDEFKTALAGLKEAIAADVEQDKEVVRVVKLLIDKINVNPNAADFTEEVALVTAATAELSGDNTDVKTALDEATQ